MVVNELRNKERPSGGAGANAQGSEEWEGLSGMEKAVLFDLDGTLLDREATLVRFLRNQRRRWLQALGHVDEDAYISRFLVLDNRGYVWKDQVYRAMVEEFGISGVSWQELLADYEVHVAAHCVPFPGLHEVLGRLRGEGWRLAVVTNGRTGLQTASIRALGIGPHLSAVLISEREGVRKPDPIMFHRAMQRLGVTPDRAVFVGDHPQNDVAGAKQAGLWAVWKKDEYWEEPAELDAAVDDLAELPELLERLVPETARSQRGGDGLE